MDKEYYVEVLRDFRKRFHRKRPELFEYGEWCLHQDNASRHKPMLATQYKADMVIQTVPNASYSTDLAPCDFWMF